MTEPEGPKGHQTEAQSSGPRPPAVRPPATRRPADAGAVLRRTPDPDRPGSWRIAQPRPRPSIVDTMDSEAGTTSSSIVDTMDKRGTPPPPVRHHATIVDTVDTPQAVHDDSPDRDPSSIVDTVDGLESMPRPARRGAVPVPTRLKGPDPRKVRGPSGPDDALMKRLREAHRKRVADRAKARGRDPGAGSTEVQPGITRSTKTHEQYLKRGRNLVKQFRRETGRSGQGDLDLDPVEFANWFFSLKPTVKPSAWRPYRQSAKAIISTIPHDDTEAALALIDADVADRESSKPEKAPAPSAADGSLDRGKLPRRTSSRKEKRFPKDDFDKVQGFLRHFSRSKFAPVLVDWLSAGISTGLRPIEWQATDVEVRQDPNAPRGRYVWLYVLNAKATNGRANGIVRTIDISQFRDETVMAIRKMSRLGGDWLLAGTYDSMQSQCAQLLYTVSERLFKGRKKIYSLYSARHQFVANAKSYHKPEGVSALVGHVVTDTAVSSYGKKRSCWSPEELEDRADPVPEEVATVRQRHVFFEDRIRLQQEAGLIRMPKPGSGEE